MSAHRNRMLRIFKHCQIITAVSEDIRMTCIHVISFHNKLTCCCFRKSLLNYLIGLSATVKCFHVISKILTKRIKITLIIYVNKQLIIFKSFAQTMRVMGFFCPAGYRVRRLAPASRYTTGRSMVRAASMSARRVRSSRMPSRQRTSRLPWASVCQPLAVWNRVTEVQPDYTVAVVSRTDPDTAFLSQLETQLEALAGDVNGDGKVKVTVKGIWLALDFETQDAALQRLMQSSEDKLNSDFYLCESALFIVDDPTAMEQRYGCFQTLDRSQTTTLPPLCPRWALLMQAPSSP